jgi:VWFA-related protein
MNPRFFGLLTALLLTSAAAARAQAPAFPARAELVVVDVVVTDGQGRPIPGLKREDFVVEEDGVPQEIVEFEAVDVAVASSGADADPSERYPVATNERPPAPARTFLVVFDDLSLTAESAETARRALQKFLDVHLRENDCLTLAPTAGGAWWTGCGSRDRGDLEAALRGLRGRRKPDTSNERMSDYEAMRIDVENDAEAARHVALRWEAYGLPMGSGEPEGMDADLHSASFPFVRTMAAEVYSRARHRTEAVLRSLERAMASLAGGRSRRVVILASDGFVHDHRLPGLLRVREAARRANAALYFLDPRTLIDPATRDADVPSPPDPDNEYRYVALAHEYYAEESLGAEALAADTGGFTVRGNDLSAGLGRIVAESRIFYLLGYAPPDSRKEGRFRKIEVTVRRPGVTVRARKGYFPGPASPEKGTAEGPPPDVRRALDAPAVDAGVPLRMMAYVLGNAAEGRVTVLLSAEADPASVALKEKDGRLVGTLDSFSTVSARESGEAGHKELVHALALRPEAMRGLQTTWLPVTHVYELPPGRYQARMAVSDRTSGRIGSVRHVFDVPSRQGLRLTTPVLTDVLAPGGGADKGGRPLPVARRTFKVGSRLLCEVEAWGGGTTVALVHEVRRADGTVVARTDPKALAADARGARADRFEMTLHRAGEYELRLHVRDGASGEEALAVERFEVVTAP